MKPAFELSEQERIQIIAGEIATLDAQVDALCNWCDGINEIRQRTSSHGTTRDAFWLSRIDEIITEMIWVKEQLADAHERRARFVILPVLS